VGTVRSTVGDCPSVLVTVRTSVPLLPAPSRAVTVITLTPAERAIDGMVQDDVPDAVPLPPRSLVQVTCVTAMSSEAVPPRAMVPLPVEYVVAAVGVAITIEGIFPSGTMKSRAPLHGPAPAAFDARTDQDARPAARATPGETRQTAPLVVQPACAGV